MAENLVIFEARLVLYGAADTHQMTSRKHNKRFFIYNNKMIATLIICLRNMVFSKNGYYFLIFSNLKFYFLDNNRYYKDN